MYLILLLYQGTRIYRPRSLILTKTNSNILLSFQRPVHPVPRPRRRPLPIRPAQPRLLARGPPRTGEKGEGGRPQGQRQHSLQGWEHREGGGGETRSVIHVDIPLLQHIVKVEWDMLSFSLPRKRSCEMKTLTKVIYYLRPGETLQPYPFFSATSKIRSLSQTVP